ncbi:hypothetical protein [Caldivirga maquilingensis]|uniref:Uncharacterized protein n=1 Tax=Caldivirga maquilingensis (strain ATCC 700844 / DSM 13496 / JCM 10307 / IC-167) TaxID=397948 RepID=A8MBE0_CALMQ|nr:hypothetical protein [Caldivirga maquilingensis]ABW01230.1 hypothetical protein Cmaq_0384 [Caldivirga maquilingensis IC-167]
MVSVRRLASVLSKELMYQGYTASRVSGLRPMNIERAVRAARINKIILSALMGFYVGLMGIIPYALKRPSVSLIETLTGSFFIIFSSLLNVAFSLQQIDNVRSLLATLPLEPRIVKSASTLSLFMIMDIPTYVSIAVSTLISVIMGGIPYPLLGTLQGISLGVIVASGFIIITERASSTISRSVSRIIGMIPIMLAVLILGYAVNINPSQLNPALSLIPVTSGLFINGLNASFYLTIVYTVAFTLAAYLMLRRVSDRILESNVQVQVIKASEFKGFRIRNPLMALVRVDLTQSFRSRMAGIWAIPVSYWVIIVFTVIAGGVRLNPMLLLTYVIELSAIIAFIPYALYLSELRGAVVFRLLPITPLRNLASKLLVTLIAYYVAMVPISVLMIIYGLPISLQAVVILAFGLPMAATGVMAILFELNIREGSVSSVSLMIIYALVMIIIEGLPAAALIIAHIMIGGYALPSLIMFLVSAVEFLMALMVLARLSRRR